MLPVYKSKIQVAFWSYGDRATGDGGAAVLDSAAPREGDGAEAGQQPSAAYAAMEVRPTHSSVPLCVTPS